MGIASFAFRYKRTTNERKLIRPPPPFPSPTENKIQEKNKIITESVNSSLTNSVEAIVDKPNVKFSFGPEYFSVRHQFVSNFIRLRYTYLSKRFSGDINACLKGIVLPAYI